MKVLTLLGLAAAGLAASALAALAAPRPSAVVELFTSQGCSSCPPADALLAELAGRPDVIALTLPVDYWDYLGWKDTLAQPAFSARQRAYAGARGDRQVFTPQMVVNGRKPCIGSDRAKLDRLMGDAGGGPDARGLPVPVDVTEAEGRVTVRVGEGAGEAEVWLVPVSRELKIQIGRGENRGRAATYVNVVRGMHRLGAWSGASAQYEARLADVRGSDADGYVVLLQETDESRPGPILGAAKGGGL